MPWKLYLLREEIMDMQTLASRRRFLCATGSLAAGMVLPMLSGGALAAAKMETEEKEKVGPTEDLMREHGVLRRLLLAYEEVIRRLDATKEIPPGVVGDCAEIIRRVVEDYHEKLEENELFPRFQLSGKYRDLVKVLYAQHQEGRRLTKRIWESSKPSAFVTPLAKQNLSQDMRAFIRMYRPHAAREDTVLFPALRSVVSPKEFNELGEKFEDKEQELFGKGGFEKMVDSVAEIEKRLGIFDLSQFTPIV